MAMAMASAGLFLEVIAGFLIHRGVAVSGGKGAAFIAVAFPPFAAGAFLIAGAVGIL